MKVVIPYWHGLVSPMFDGASTILLVDIVRGTEVQRKKKTFRYTNPLSRVRYLVNLGTHTLICGAISRHLEFTLQSSGIKVVSNICGPTEEVLKAFLNGALLSSHFLMPGYIDRGRSGRNRTNL